MLARHLKQLRAAKVIETSQAATALGQGWTENQGSFKRDFVFADFTEASHFLERYSEYCQKTNMSPEWSNVYNRVSVTLANKEFGGVTRKEIAAGSFLNMVSKVTLNQDVEDVLRFEQVVEVARIETLSKMNNQAKSTSLFIAEENKAINTERLLLQ